MPGRWRAPLCTLQADWLAGLDQQHTPPLQCLRSCFRLPDSSLAWCMYLPVSVANKQTLGMYVRDYTVLVPALYIAHKPRLRWGTVGI